MSVKRFCAWCATGIFVLGASVPAATASPPARSASSGGLYIALGDSVMSGANNDPNVPGTTGFAERLLPHYESTLGVTDLKTWVGNSSEHLRTGGALAGALEDINAESDTKVLTIENGAHDLLGGCDFTSPSCPFRANFSATLGDLQAALANDPGDEPLIAMAYYNANVGLPGEATADRRLLGTPAALNCADAGDEVGLNDTIAQEADRHQALLADVYPAFKLGGQTFMTGDGLHPNSAGQAAITEAFIDAAPACSRPYVVPPPPPPEPPPPEPPPPEPPPPEPSSDFSFGKAKKNKRKGTAKLPVEVPGPGELELAKTKKVKKDTEQVDAAAARTAQDGIVVKLKVKPKGKAKKKLNRTGKAKVKAKVTYTPDGGEPNTRKKKLKLKKR